jgi:hypothetical protein
MEPSWRTSEVAATDRAALWRGVALLRLRSGDRAGAVSASRMARENRELSAWARRYDHLVFASTPPKEQP